MGALMLLLTLIGLTLILVGWRIEVLDDRRIQRRLDKYCGGE